MRNSCEISLSMIRKDINLILVENIMKHNFSYYPIENIVINCIISTNKIIIKKKLSPDDS